MNKRSALSTFLEKGKITEEQKIEFETCEEELKKFGIDTTYFFQQFVICVSKSQVLCEMKRELQEQRKKAAINEKINKIKTLCEIVHKDSELADIFFVVRQLVGLDEENIFSVAKIEFHKKFGWAIPSEEALDAIESFVGCDTILSVASGKGFWEYLIQKKGMKIITTDIGSSGQYYSDKELQIESWLQPEQLSAERAVEKYKDKVIFICWASPDFNDDFIDNFEGNKIIVIGESDMGCTYNGDDVLKFGFILEKTIEIPRWHGLEDTMRFYTK